MNHRIEKMNDGFHKHFIQIEDENGKPFEIILHHFTSEDKGYPHDHPFRITSQIVSGSYVEEIYEIDGKECDGLVCTAVENRTAGTINVIEAGTIHKITSLPQGEAWTIARYGPEEKTSGFYQFEEDRVLHRYWNQDQFEEYKR